MENFSIIFQKILNQQAVFELICMVLVGVLGVKIGETSLFPFSSNVSFFCFSKIVRNSAVGVDGIDNEPGDKLMKLACINIRTLA